MSYADRVKEVSTTTGTGAIALAGAATGFRTFAAGFTVGATMPYAISDALGNWEIGTGTLSASTTLARTTVLASSNGNSLVNFPAGSKDVFCTLSAAQIAAFQVSQDVAFSTTIPLTVAGTQYMPQQTVSSVLAFTAASSPVKGASVYVRLLADGVNAPTFTGMKEWGGSLGYDNRNQIANQVQFFYDGVDTFYSISQAVGAVPVAPAATSVTMTGPTSGTVSTASTNFTVGVSPVGGTIAGTVVVTPSDSGAGGAFSPTTVSLTTAAPTATFTYTPNATAGAKTISATNNGGLSNPANITYTASAAVANPRLSQLASVTESGTGPYSYTGTGGSFGAAFGGLSTTGLQSGADGSMSCVLGGYTNGGTNEVMMGINTGSTVVAFGSLPQAFYAKGSPAIYTPFSSGAGQTATNNVIPANGDIMRMRRSGTNVIAEVSKDSGSTYTTIFTWASAGTAAAKFQVMPASTSQANTLAGSNLA